jgi:hypothetical protein
MHATIGAPPKKISPNAVEMARLQEALVAARSSLVAAVAARASDEVVAPLRSHVCELLEKIARLHQPARFGA